MAPIKDIYDAAIECKEFQKAIHSVLGNTYKPNFPYNTTRDNYVEKVLSWQYAYVYCFPPNICLDYVSQVKKLIFTLGIQYEAIYKANDEDIQEATIATFQYNLTQLNNVLNLMIDTYKKELNKLIGEL